MHIQHKRKPVLHIFKSTPFMFKHQAVLLVSGSSDHLLPLNTTGLPAALLPVANQPLITFPLHLLDAGGVRDVLLVRPLSYCRLSCLPLPLHVLHLLSAVDRQPLPPGRQVEQAMDEALTGLFQLERQPTLLLCLRCALASSRRHV